MPQRWIILVDLDAFYASVEELLDPSLRGKPVIVGGDPRKRGVVSAASYPARAYGVHSAMPMAQAVRLCPQAVVIPPRRHEYSRRSRAVMDLLGEYTPAMEQVSIDEAFLDVTGCEKLWGPPRQIAAIIQARIREEHGLSASLGVASSRLVAKIASEQGKPGGLVVVPPGEEAEFLAPLPIESLWGVGPVTAEHLHSWNVTTIGDLASWSMEQLTQVFGDGGRRLYEQARGIDGSPVLDAPEQRSISQEHTFASDVGDARLLQRTLLRMSEELSRRLRQRRLVAQGVRLKLRYPDLSIVTRQTRLEQPTDQGQIVYACACELLQRVWPAGQRIRLIGIGVWGLLEEGGYQLALFSDADQRRSRLNAAVDQIRDRFGSHAIARGAWLRRGGPEEDED